MVAAGYVRDPALAPHAPLVAQVARDPLALVVVPLAARVPVVPAGGPLVVAPVAMARAVVEAEADHMAAAMATDHRQPHHARQRSPSSRAARSRFRRRSSSKTWRNCSVSRSMR